MKYGKKAIILALLCGAAALQTLFSDSASDAASGAMHLCASSVIPALFPYMVISSLLVSTGTAEIMGRLLPVSKLYGLPACAGAAIIIGAICGFPVGAKAACDLYKRGNINKCEAEVLISVSNNTGPSFVVAVIGGAFWGSTAFGWQLYAFQLASSLMSGIIINRILFPVKHSQLPSTPFTAEERLSVQFSSAVYGAVSASLNVCGYVVFFAVIISFCKLFFGTSAVYFAQILEFTEGTKTAAAVSGTAGIFLCGFSLGWSGISVFCQTGAFALPLGLSLKRCIVTKALQGLLCGGLSALFCRVQCPPAAAQTVYEAFLPCFAASALLFLFSAKIAHNRYKM